MDKIEAFLSLGSNSVDAPQMLALAREAIGTLADIVGASPVYRTEPQDYRDQPWFHNQVLKLEVGKEWNAPALLEKLLAIEKDLGRTRGALRFGPRRIDIDLLLFGAETRADPLCTVPHPRMTDRAFVLVPLADLAPELEIMGKTPADWLAALDWRLDGRDIYQP